MPIFYPPPGPYIGGRQPYDPGRRVTPPVSESNPPFGSGPRINGPEFQTIAQWWVPPFPGFIGGRQPFDPGRRVTPPVGEGSPPPRPPNVLNSILAQWQPGPPQPQQLPPKQVVSVAVVTSVPFNNQWLSTVLRAWQPAPPQPTQLPETQVRSESNPPFSSISQAQFYAQVYQGLDIVIPIQLPVNSQTTTSTTAAPILSTPDWLSTVLQAWQPAPPQPQQLEQNQIVSEGPPVPSLEWQQAALAWWYVPWVYPQRLNPIAALIPPAVVAAQPTYAPAWLPTVLQAWQPGPPLPQRLASTPIVTEGNPPPTTDTLQNLLVQLWQPGPPQPYQLVQYAPIPPAVVNNPPFPGVNWFNTVLQAWQPGPPQPTQLVQNVVQEGIAPPIPPIPPEPPRGGAPIYWPGTSSAYRREEVEIERQARDLRARIEIGLVKVKEEKERVEERIEKKVDKATVKSLIAKPGIDVEKISKKVAKDVKDDLQQLRALQKQIEEMEAESEALEALEIAMIVFFSV